LALSQILGISSPPKPDLTGINFIFPQLLHWTAKVDALIEGLVAATIITWTVINWLTKLELRSLRPLGWDSVLRRNWKSGTRSTDLYLMETSKHTSLIAFSN